MEEIYKIFGGYIKYPYFCGMKIKVKYHIEANIETQQVIIECQTLEEAEKKLKNLLRGEQEAYIVKTVETGKSKKECFFII